MQQKEAGFLLLPCGFWESSPDHQAWWQAPFPTDPSCWSLPIIFVCFVLYGSSFYDVLHVLVFCPHGYLCTTCMPGAMEDRKGRQISAVGVTDVWELPCGCWELNPGPLKEQPVLLTAEPSLQPL